MLSIAIATSQPRKHLARQKINVDIGQSVGVIEQPALCLCWKEVEGLPPENYGTVTMPVYTVHQNGKACSLVALDRLLGGTTIGQLHPLTEEKDESCKHGLTGNGREVKCRRRL